MVCRNTNEQKETYIQTKNIRAASPKEWHTIRCLPPQPNFIATMTSYMYTMSQKIINIGHCLFKLQLKTSGCFLGAHGVYSPLCENMMSTTKLELLKVFHYYQRKTETWSQVTWLEKFVQCRCVVFGICDPTYIHTNIHTYRQTHKPANFNPSPRQSNSNNNINNIT